MMGRRLMSRRLELDEYFEIRDKIGSPRDFETFKIPNYVLSAILNRKIVEDVMRRYWRYKPEIVARIWRERGVLNVKLPPVLRLKLLLKGLGYGKGEIRNMLENPREAGDLESLIWNAITKDYVYSPIAVKFQREKGLLGERMIECILNEMGFEFKRENEIEGRKTPDFLISSKIRWIESKFMFGDISTHSFYWRKQYLHYFKEFGKGFVVYWCWHLDLPFSTSGDVKMSVRFRFKRLRREKFLKKLEFVLREFSKGRNVEVSGNRRLMEFLKGLGFDIKVPSESHLSF